MTEIRSVAALLFLFGCADLYGQTVVDTLYCEADVTVSQAAPGSYAPGGGRQGYMLVGAGGGRQARGEHRAYLRFSLNGIDPSSVERASLMLWKSRSRSDTLRVYAVADDKWSEYGTFWNNAPEISKPVSAGYCSQGWSTFEVTGYIRGETDNSASFGLRVENGTNAGLGLNSREGGAPPMLVVTHRGPSKSGKPPTPGFPSSSSLKHGVYIHDSGKYTPYENISSAISNIQPGQEIVLGPGVYYESFALSAEGTEQSPLKIRGDGDPRPIIDGSLSSSSWQNSDRGLILVNGKNWIIEHLEIRNAHPWGEAVANSGCFYIRQAENTIIRDCAVYFGGNGIFSTEESVNLTVEHSEIAYNSTPGAGYEHGHYVNNAGALIMRFNYIHDNGGMNFKTRAEDCVFAYNFVHSCGNYQLDFSDGAKFTDQDALLIGNVIITDNPERTNSQFIVFGENRHGGSITLCNNTFINLYPEGSGWVHMWFKEDTQVLGTELIAYNNVFYHLSSRGSMSFYRSEKPVPVIGSNNWITTGTTDLPGTLVGSIQGTDPGLVDIQGGDFRPRPASPLVDKGDPRAPQLPQYQYQHKCKNLPRYEMGSSVDIGAYEYNP